MEGPSAPMPWASAWWRCAIAVCWREDWQPDLRGVYLSLAYTQMWVDHMTAGRAWIALAMVIFGTWDPVRAALGAYLFGGVQALQLRLQAIGIAMPAYLLMMAPYGFTVLALIIASGHRAQWRLGTSTAPGAAYIRGG